VFTFARPEGIQVSELTRRARVRKQTVAQAVEDLEDLGYVERRPDPNDRRARLEFLTARRVAARWAELTSPKEMASLQRSLETLLAKLAGDSEPDATRRASGRRAPALGVSVTVRGSASRSSGADYEHRTRVPNDHQSTGGAQSGTSGARSHITRGGS
jgi:DNA-binding transcriptional ArsR family regulator